MKETAQEMKKNTEEDEAKNAYRRSGIWAGTRPGVWWSLLWRHGFAIEPRYVPSALSTTLQVYIRAFFAMLAALRFKSKVEATEIIQPPLFVLGHWRSGTTYMHELLTQDENHTFSNTFECVFPNQFLSSEKLMVPLINRMLPIDRVRPMDDMPLDMESPQEDEFALYAMGAPSPYLHTAFPNQPAGVYDQSLDLINLPEKQRKKWKDSLLYFYKSLILYKGQKRIVSKSPPHTARIKTILEVFPDARFVFIVRDPYRVIPSTLNLLKTLYEVFGFQTPSGAYLEEEIITTYCRLHDAFEEARPLVPENRLHVVRYEDIAANPVEMVAQTYAKLELGTFDDALRSKVQAFVDERNKDRKGGGKYPMPPELEAKITRRLRHYIEYYGYEPKSSLPLISSNETPLPFAEPAIDSPS